MGRRCCSSAVRRELGSRRGVLRGRHRGTARATRGGRRPRRGTRHRPRLRPPGVGAVRNRRVPIPNWVDDYDGVLGTEFKFRDLGPSFRELAAGREYDFDPRLTVFDVIGDCDLPRLLAALDDRTLRVDRCAG